MTNREILLEWINVYIPSQHDINPDTCFKYRGDTAEPFVNIQEWVYRKELITEYLKEPTEETIQKFLDTLKEDLDYGDNVDRRAVNKILARFNKPTI